MTSTLDSTEGVGGLLGVGGLFGVTPADDDVSAEVTDVSGLAASLVGVGAFGGV